MDSDSIQTSQNAICPSCEKQVDKGIKFCPTCGTPIIHAPGNDDLVGRIVAGKYRVEAQIGEGGMGQVFRATQLSLDKSIVLKVLRKNLLSDARTVARFQREAKAASRINHPNAIGIIDFGQDSDDSLFIAMEYVPGRDLHQILTDEGPITEKRLIRIMAQVLAALSDAHAAGVIHRDLKPENIMVEQRRDQPDFVKVLDFGIAKLQDASSSDGPALTRVGFVCGTPEYMSPEQASGSEIDPRSDLYGVGVILYQCLTGMLPFDADSPVALATMHLTDDPVPPRAKNPNITCSDGMEALILRAMAKVPEDRPQTAEEFRAALFDVEKSQRAAARRHGKSAGRTNAGLRLDHVHAKLSEQPSSVVVSLGSGSATPVDTLQAAAAPKLAKGTTPDGEDFSGLVASARLRLAALSRNNPVVLYVVGAALVFLLVLGIGALVLSAGNSSKLDPRLAVEQGDRALLAKQYAQALHYYQLAYQAEPSAQHTKRKALAQLAMGDADNLAKTLRQYQKEGADLEEIKLINGYLDALRKASVTP